MREDDVSKRSRHICSPSSIKIATAIGIATSMRHIHDVFVAPSATNYKMLRVSLKEISDCKWFDSSFWYDRCVYLSIVVMKCVATTAAGSSNSSTNSINFSETLALLIIRFVYRARLSVIHSPTKLWANEWDGNRWFSPFRSFTISAKTKTPTDSIMRANDFWRRAISSSENL